MTPLRRLATTVAPFLVSGACAQLIGLSDYEKGEVTGSAGEGDDGGEGGVGGSRGGNGGSSGNQNGGSGGRGGSRTGGEGGMGGESTGGEAGEMGTGGDPSGGRGGAGAGQGGAAGGGMGGTGGNSGGGTGGSAGGVTCNTVVVPIASGNFDGDNSAWIPYSDGSAIPIIAAAASLGITADTPPNVAHLGGAHEQYSGQFQPITIPAGTNSLTLTGYRYIVSDEDPQSEMIYDDMAIQMWEDALNGTGRVADFVYYSHQDPTNGWTLFTSTAAVGPYAGQTVDLDMWSFTDESVFTHFYIDSLELTAFVCQ